jgi:hypothetical protein
VTIYRTGITQRVAGAEKLLLINPFGLPQLTLT